MKKTNNKIFLFFYSYFYLIRDIIQKDYLLRAYFKSMKYGFLIMNLYTIFNTIYYLMIL